MTSLRTDVGRVPGFSSALRLICGCAAAVVLLALPAFADKPSTQPAGKRYTVRQGDSAWAIAKRTGVSQQAILKANGLSERSVLRPGQKLVVPGPRRPGSSSHTAQAASPAPLRRASYAGRVHVVREGESLEKIARGYHVSVKALVQANGIRNRHLIRAGRKLVIPVVGAPRSRGSQRASAQEPQAGTDDDLVQTALRYRGVPYRYAGTTTRGMDCSGLVFRALAMHGIRAPHSSRALYSLGQPVSRAELQRGDLVFFHTRGRGISHVGIYIGEGRFVHASSGGGRVEVDRLDTGYYAQRFVGARRVS
jgi:cell wall-associated NlpC family hydrolase